MSVRSCLSGEIPDAHLTCLSPTHITCYHCLLGKPQFHNIGNIVVKQPQEPAPTTKLHTITVVCPICSESVGGSRFAPHLEKCMNGGKRGSRKYSDNMFDDDISKITKPKQPENPDRYPTSLVVRIKLKNDGKSIYPSLLLNNSMRDITILAL